MRTRNGAEPHTHVLPNGFEWSTPANDRTCRHVPAHNPIRCTFPSCGAHLGRECRKCRRVV